MTTSGEPDIAVPARAMSDPRRAAMLVALVGGEHLPAGELSRLAGVAPATGSEHLAQLEAAGLVVVTRQGRHRYYALAGPDVAVAVEALQALAPVRPAGSLRSSTTSLELARGRRCYDHLAGDLGLRLTGILVRGGVVPALAPGDCVAAPGRSTGGAVVESLGIKLAPPPGSRRPWARGCLDWTGRRSHLAGYLGAELAATLERRQWTRAIRNSRALRLTPAGEKGLEAVESLVPPA